MQIKELTRTSKKFITQDKKDELLKKLRKEHEKMVKGMFEFIDAQGGWLDFTYRFFKEDPMMTIRLVHGEICDLPMGIVKHLNNTYKKVRVFGKDDANTNSAIAGRLLTDRGSSQEFTKTSRVRFIPMDVM